MQYIQNFAQYEARMQNDSSYSVLPLLQLSVLKSCSMLLYDLKHEAFRTADLYLKILKY